MRKTVLTALFLALFASTAAVGQSDLDAAFDYLPAYEFGQDRTALSFIENALHEAAKTDRAGLAELEARLIAVLGGACTDDAAGFICRLLAVYGEAASVPVLMGVMDNPAVAEAALDALERNPSPEARAAVRTIIEKRDGALRVRAVEAAGARADAEAVTVLAPLAESADAALRAAALRALARIGAKDAGEAVRSAAEAGGAGDLTALDALQILGNKLQETGQDAAAKEIFELLYVETHPVHVRAAALGGLIEIDPSEADTRIAAAFEDDDPAMQRLAMGFLREVEGDALPAAFAARLLEYPPETRVLLLATLRDRGTPIAAETLSKLVTSGDEAVQLAAIDAMPACAGADGVPILLDRAAFDARLVKRSARDALLAMPGDSVNEALLAQVVCGEPELAGEALRALGGRAATVAADPILGLLEAGCPALEEASWRALRDLAGGGQLERMLALLGGIASPGARTEAERTIAAAAKRAADPEAATGAVLALHEGGAPRALRVSLVRIAGNIAGDRALAFLTDAASATDPEVRVEAVKALGAWPDSAPVDGLLEVAAAAPDAATRDAAVDGVLGLLRRTKDAAPDTRARWFNRAARMACAESEKKSLLAALADLAHPEALSIIALFADDPALAQEVQRAQLNAASTLLGACPGQVLPMLESVRDQAGDDNVRSAATGMLARLQGMQDYLTAWLVAGPYSESGKSGAAMLDMAFPPEESGAGDAVAWQVMPMGLQPEAPYVIDLGGRFDKGEHVAYLMTAVSVPAACAAILELGSNDGVKVWLNGSLVHENNVGRPLTPAEDKVSLDLNAGANALMLKVSNEGGEWAAAARLTAPDGGPLAGATSSLPLD